jgi:hypothetical protein
MSTNRELLELAAKAVGIEIWFADDGGAWGGGDKCLWNPLEDDGDALRLMVELQIKVDFDRHANSVHAEYWCGESRREAAESTNTDRVAATRRSIVRAAAALGEAMP